MTDAIFNIKDKDLAAEAYAEEMCSCYSNDHAGFLAGMEYYERTVVQLKSLTPDDLLERVLAATTELELLQLSTVLLVNGSKYKPEVAPQIAQAIGDTAKKIVMKTLNND